MELVVRMEHQAQMAHRVLTELQGLMVPMGLVVLTVLAEQMVHQAQTVQVGLMVHQVQTVQVELMVQMGLMGLREQMVQMERQVQMELAE